MCTNTEGSFVCGCVPGFLINMDETLCEGIQPSSTNAFCKG